MDFGQAEFIENGVKITGHYLNVSFPYSNCGYTQVFKSENQESFLTGLKKNFEHIGCVPDRIWLDNLSAAVVTIKKHGDRDLTEMFKRFALHYGFECNFCNPNSGHEKGSVENKVGYHRRNFFVLSENISLYQLSTFRPTVCITRCTVVFTPIKKETRFLGAGLRRYT
ncbi:hypothetical protein ULO1_03810 [Carboxydocella sp. ULO1]|nr:hypothetical protein ULO1_03810 [Carboxydocella sp. ULO1]